MNLNTGAPELGTPEASRSGLWTFLWAVTAAFGAYFCMYGVRKPFSVATYEGVPPFYGLDYKPLLITAQILGYTLSKFIGITVVSGLSPRRRAAGILILIGIAELALVAFGLVGAPWNFVCLVFNGLPLGMVFGLVMGFLEGRRQSEAMLAGLCCSFIVADGVVKAVGAQLLNSGVPQMWMPAATGLIFILPLVFFVWALSRVPAPDHADIEARAARSPMDSADRRRILRRYAPGLVLITGLYLLITVLRSLRSDFAPELWKALGTTSPPSVFAKSEIYVGLAVAATFALLTFVRSNRLAFFASLAMCLAGLALGILVLTAHALGLVAPFAFIVLLGVALYLPYVAVHVCVFERLLAVTRDKANIGFLMYLVDAFGYLGYVALMFGKNSVKSQPNIWPLFSTTAWTVMLLGFTFTAAAILYFRRHPALTPPGTPAPQTP